MDNNKNDNMSRQHRQRTRNSALASNNAGKIKRPFVKILGLVFLVMIFVMGAYGFRLYAQAQNSLGKTYKAIDGKKVSTRINNKQPISILLLGVDTTDNGIRDTETNYRGNSDTMIVVTVNPKTNKTTMVSVPRDTMAQIWKSSTNNTRKIQKINSAYNIGNEGSAVATTEKLLNVPIDYYVKVDFNSLKQIVNAVGGVDVNVPFSFSYGDTGEKESHFKKGKMHLNGKQALDYSRMRYEDPEGDYGRQKRQRQVIKSIVKNAISLNTVANLESILNSLEKNVKTNLTFNNLISIMRNYTDAADEMKSDYLHGTPAFIGDASYQVMATTELQRISDLVRSQMGLEQETLDNNETYQNEQNTTFDWKSGVYTQPYTIYSKNSPGVVWNGSN